MRVGCSPAATQEVQTWRSSSASPPAAPGRLTTLPISASRPKPSPSDPHRPRPGTAYRQRRRHSTLVRHGRNSRPIDRWPYCKWTPPRCRHGRSSRRRPQRYWWGEASYCAAPMGSGDNSKSCRPSSKIPGRSSCPRTVRQCAWKMPRTVLPPGLAWCLPQSSGF